MKRVWVTFEPMDVTQSPYLRLLPAASWCVVNRDLNLLLALKSIDTLRSAAANAAPCNPAPVQGTARQSGVYSLELWHAPARCQ